MSAWLKGQGATVDFGEWLRSLGLEKYEAVLRDNEIDEAVLHKLTEDHLRELGMPLGARLKLLDTIAALGSARPAAALQDSSPPPRSDLRPPPCNEYSIDGSMFLGFSADQKRLSRMLDSMTGFVNGTRDALTRYTQPLTGSYSFVPSVESLWRFR
jgi:hypothetical protein